MKKLGVKAVVLAGGLGTRLRPYTFFVPKPMLPLGEKPVLEHIIVWLKRYGVEDFVISVGYLRRILEDYFRNGRELGVKICYARADRPLGTAGQLKAAERFIDGTFLCLYGDTIFEFDIRKTLGFHKAKKAAATLILKPYGVTMKYGFIDLARDGAVKSWREKPEVKGLINTGCYVMEPSFLKHIPKGKMFGMDTAFNEALKAGERIYGYVAEGEFIDIGDKKAYMAAYEKYLNRLGKIL